MADRPKSFTEAAKEVLVVHFDLLRTDEERYRFLADIDLAMAQLAMRYWREQGEGSTNGVPRPWRSVPEGRGGSLAFLPRPVEAYREVEGGLLAGGGLVGSVGGALGYAVEGLERMKIDYEKTRSGQALVQDAIERGVFMKGQDGVVYGPFPLSSVMLDRLKAGLQKHLRTVVRGE